MAGSGGKGGSNGGGGSSAGNSAGSSAGCSAGSSAGSSASNKGADFLTGTQTVKYLGLLLACKRVCALTKKPFKKQQ